jgi:hypothetical protein
LPVLKIGRKETKYEGKERKEGMGGKKEGMKAGRQAGRTDGVWR